MTRVAGLLGSLWGLVCALALSGIRFANSSEPERDPISTVAFTLVYAAPFVLALVAMWWKSAAQRAAVWLAAAVLAFLAGWTAFSGISLIFLLAAPLLLLAAAVSAAQAIQTVGVRSALLILPVSIGLIGVGVAAFVALITLTFDPRCWVLMRDAGGYESWQIAPPDLASIIVINGPNGQQAFGSGTMPPQSADGSSPLVPGIVTSTCTSDIISPIESGVSLGLWVFAAVALIAVRRFWDTAQSAGEASKG
jgi:hypothetical protein